MIFFPKYEYNKRLWTLQDKHHPGFFSYLSQLVRPEIAGPKSAEPKQSGDHRVLAPIVLGQTAFDPELVGPKL